MTELPPSLPGAAPWREAPEVLIEMADTVVVTSATDRLRFLCGFGTYKPDRHRDYSITVKQIVWDIPGEHTVPHFETQTTWQPLGRSSPYVPLAPPLGEIDPGGRGVSFPKRDLVIPAGATVWGILLGSTFDRKPVWFPTGTYTVRLIGAKVPAVAIE